MKNIYIYLSLVILIELTCLTYCGKRLSNNDTSITAQPAPIESLPQDIKAILLNTLIQGSFKEAIKNIKSLASVNKDFYKLMTNQNNLTKTINLIAQNTWASRITIASALSSPAALQWLKNYLSQEPDEKLGIQIVKSIDNKKFSLAKLLLTHAIKSSSKTPSNTVKDKYPSSSPLVKAIKAGNLDIVLMILASNLPKNTLNTALCVALELKNQKVVQLLRSAGAQQEKSTKVIPWRFS